MDLDLSPRLRSDMRNGLAHEVRVARANLAYINQPAPDDELAQRADQIKYAELIVRRTERALAAFDTAHPVRS